MLLQKAYTPTSSHLAANPGFNGKHEVEAFLEELAFRVLVARNYDFCFKILKALAIITTLHNFCNSPKIITPKYH